MKKDFFSIAIALLVLLQIVILYQNNNLKNEMESLRNEMYNISNSVRNETSSLYANINTLLQQEASLIENADTQIGALNKDDLTVSIVFSLVPKEVSADTQISLELDGVLFPMDREGTNFSAAIACGLFSSAMPMVLITDNGVTRSTQDNRIGISSIKHFVFPTLYPRLDGSSTYDGKTYKRKGSIYIDTKAIQSAIQFTGWRLVVLVDETVVSDVVIPEEAFSGGYTLNEAVPLTKGQLCKMMLIATDDMGLEHRYVVDHWDAGARAQREPWFRDEEIYSANGELIWKQEYERAY